MHAAYTDLADQHSFRENIVICENQLNQRHQRSIWRINRTQMHTAYTDLPAVLREGRLGRSTQIKTAKTRLPATAG